MTFNQNTSFAINTLSVSAHYHLLRQILRQSCASFSLFHTLMTSSGQNEQKKLQLYSYHKSSCSFRVRIALNLKGVDYEYKSVNLSKGEQKTPEFLKINPMGYVPALVDGDIVISDSFAIIMYLEDKYPQHPLLPRDLEKRAINYQAANIVSAGIQPVRSLDVLATLEILLKNHAGKYATGDDVFLADLFLVPQIHVSVQRLNFDMKPYPLLARLYGAYMQVPAIQDALPENQPDFPST